MDTNALNDLLTTAMEAINILCRTKRTVLRDGSTVLIFDMNDEYVISSEDFNANLSTAYQQIQQVPELSAMLEIRILQMQTQSATKRLKNITG
jgi:hypothetical protein